MPGSTRQPLAFSFLLSKLPKPPLLFSTGGSYGSCRSTKGLDGRVWDLLCSVQHCRRMRHSTPGTLLSVRQPAILWHCETLLQARPGRRGTHPHGNGLLYAQPICELHNPLQGRAGRDSTVGCTSGSPNEAKHRPHRLWGQDPVSEQAMAGDADASPARFPRSSRANQSGPRQRHRQGRACWRTSCSPLAPPRPPPGQSQHSWRRARRR